MKDVEGASLDVGREVIQLTCGFTVGDQCGPTTGLDPFLEFQVFVDHILTPYAKKHGLGQISAEKMKTTRNVVTGFFKTPRIPEVSELYSNKVLPKLFPKRKKVDCKLCP